MARWKQGMLIGMLMSMIASALLPAAVHLIDAFAQANERRMLDDMTAQERDAYHDAHP